VHIEFYILQTDDSTDNLFRALEEVAARGVTVRVLLDHWANRGKPFYKKTLKRLDAMGAQWHLMLPVQPFKGKYQRPDLRNHRKLVVVDGRVGFMGSQNLIARTYDSPKNIKRGLQWQELMTRLTGPVVAAVNGVGVGIGITLLLHCDYVYIESNHDVDMLMDGPYPYDLKLRIRGRRGHLSNRECADLAAELAGQGTTHFLLAHLSEENNHPDIAYDETFSALAGYEATLRIASPNAVTMLVGEAGSPIEKIITETPEEVRL
jgi:hypothetical protein